MVSRLLSDRSTTPTALLVVSCLSFACSLTPALPPAACFAEVCHPSDVSAAGDVLDAIDMDTIDMDTTNTDATGADAQSLDQAPADVAPDPCEKLTCGRWQHCQALDATVECACLPDFEAITLSAGAKTVLQCGLLMPAWGLRPLSPDSFELTSSKVVSDKRTHLMWERKPPTALVSWENAVARCQSLGIESHTDWRLPTIVELQSVVDFKLTSPVVSTKYFPGAPASLFWTRTRKPVPGSSAVARWAIDFGTGQSATYYEEGSAAGRCVRTNDLGEASEPLTTPRFETSGDKSAVVDRWTGLTWRVAVSHGHTKPSQGATECKNAPGATWRLPSVVELLTLADYRLFLPARDRTSFPKTKASVMWSSTPHPIESDQYWGVSPNSGSALPIYAGGTSLQVSARCVHGP